MRLCLASDSSNAAALNNLALLNMQSGDFEKAKSYLMTAKDINPDCPEIKTNVALMDKSYKIVKI